MFKTSRISALTALLCLVAGTAMGQSYRAIPGFRGGIITGSVKWSGPQPRLAALTINKDPQICDPDSQKTRDLERLIIGPDGGVANTVVFLRNISSGKPFDFPTSRRSLDQRHCRYEPHIMLVPENDAFQMKSSDATLHTIHMDGAATYNLPFPFPNQVVSRPMPSAALVNLRCNGGHVWMNAEMFVAPHPYYAVTDQSGRFELTDVPPGDYEIVAWHEGWHLLRQEGAFDVFTQNRIQRPIFSDARTWEQKVRVGDKETEIVNFVMSEK